VTPDPDQLAELARKRGLKLKRSRVRKADKPGFGRFGLTGADDRPVFGIGPGNALDASVEEIEDYLPGLDQQDWQGSVAEAGATVSPKRRGRAAKAARTPAAAPAPPPAEPELREANGRDAEQLAGLFALLDHRIAPEQVSMNLQALAQGGEPVLVVAADDRLLGAIGYHATPMPHRDPPIGRATVLVLAEDARRRGLGRRLLLEAERRLAGLGCGIVEVTSNARLREAHAFYRHLGYERTSMRFAKALPGR